MKPKISISNTIKWMIYGLKHPSSFFNRKCWGVFSPYAHVRRSDGRPKVAQPSKEKAIKVAESMSKKYGGHYSIYKCVYCDGWHVSNDAKPETKTNKTEIFSKIDIPETLQFDKILALDIPDIARVYGGVRGRTMSSVHQNFAWPIIRDAGIRTIIDLREDGVYTRMNGLCEKYGMHYLYYPVDNKCKSVESMVNLLPELCARIDAGNFYIACAMGLHRTDIALCTYWMFHGADRGLEPPEIRGYREDQGHNTEKIMRVLNAVYVFMTERNGGVPPLPLDIFKARKAVINSQSKKQPQ